MPVFRFDHLVHADNKGYHKSSDVSPGKTEVEQGKSVEFISTSKGYFRVTCKSQNLNTASTTPKFTVGIIQIEVKSLSTSSIKNKLICAISISDFYLASRL